MFKASFLGRVTLLVLLTTSAARAADWPMWRCDAGRTGASAAELPPQLHLRWTRELPPTLLAWPNESRLHFDLSTRAEQPMYAVRSGCSNSLVAADGVLSAPNFAVRCVCNYPVQTAFAMFPSPEAGQWLPRAQ